MLVKDPEAQKAEQPLSRSNEEGKGKIELSIYLSVFINF